MTEAAQARPRVRWSMLWVATLVLLAGYFLLPGATDRLLSDAQVATVDAAGEPRRLEIAQIAPREATLGGSAVVTFTGADDTAAVRVLSGKEELTILARRPGTAVVRLPPEALNGYLKIRVVVADERSKAYHLRVGPLNWRRPFGNLLGGLALLVFGIGIFARGARESLGLASAQKLATLAARTPVALGLGAVVGGLVQSTTAAAGLLSGLVASNLLAVVPAAAVFLGAQVGAASVPLMVTIDPQSGLMVVAVGVLWLVFAPDRRATALGRLMLGLGLIAFGLQALRSGFEPFVAEPNVLPFVERLQADSLLGVAACALLGALLVAAFQGPVPALALVFALGQVTSRVDFRLALAVLAGSGLGAGLAGLLTTQTAALSRRLAQLNLMVGAASTVIASASIGLWSDIAARLAGSPVGAEAGAMASLTGAGYGRALGTAFAMSQLAGAVLLLPTVGFLARLIDRRWPGSQAAPIPVRPEDAMEAAREGLVRMLGAQHDSLEPLSLLAISGQRVAGGLAEHALSTGRAAVEAVISGPLRMLPPTPEGVRFGRAAFACLQLERALEGVLLQAERLTERRVTTPGGIRVPPLPSADEETIREIQGLFAQGLQALAASLDRRATIDLEQARGREIEMNGCDARARNALLAPNQEPSVVATHMGVIELVDAYEIAGNQAYRLAEALANLDEHCHLVAAV